MIFYVLIVTCILLTIFALKKNSDYWKKRDVVQYDGKVWKFLFKNCSLAEIYKEIYDKYKNESNVGIFLGSKPALLLRDLDNIQTVLASDFQSFNSRGIFITPKDVLADNVLFMEDFHRWRLVRQKISPVFTSSKLKNMFYLVERSARDFVEMIKENSVMTEKPFNSLYTYTIASIGASIFGIDTNTNQSTMDSPFLEMTRKSLEPSLIGNLAFVVGNIFPELFKLIEFKPFGEHEKFFVGVVRKVLESRRNEKEKRHDFIDICVELQKLGVMKDLSTGFELEPSDELLAAQAFFFFLAGTDTSANTMHFTLIELSNNPNILAKVHEEIDQVFSDCNEIVTYNDMEKLHYLDMVINEALRKYPPIGLMQRKCTKDTILPVGHIKLQKDDLIVIPVYGIHRDETYFPNPELFDPERFSLENFSKIPKFSYLPFGEGNRVCLGMRFARLQVKAGIAWLLRRYTLRHQSVKIDKFEPSPFSLRVSDIGYELIPRSL